MRFLKEQQKKKVFARKKEILNLNLQLRADDNFKILNNMADIEMVGDFIITGTNLQTGIMGNINVLEGELRLADHNYHIDSAFFEFKERYKIYPYFNIQAFTEVEDALNEKKYRVNISINGYPDKYIIDYSADDSLVSKADILMLLTLGMTKKNMEETGNQDSLFDQNSLGMLSKLSGIDSKQILPIPRSRILWNRTFSEETGTFVPQVGIKWSMVPGLDFYYFSSLQDSKEQSLQLEYQINEFTSLNSDWKNINNKTGGGGLGADLKFRWEY